MSETHKFNIEDYSEDDGIARKRLDSEWATLNAIREMLGILGVSHPSNGKLR
jgi:hypothetical protein